MRREGRERNLVLKWEGEHGVLCVGTEDWEELNKAQVLEMEEYGGSHERVAAQGPSVGQDVTTKAKVGVCGCREIRTLKEIAWATYKGRFVEWSGARSSGDRSLLELRDLSAARSSERKERSSVLASETGELASKGLVNWGRPSAGEVAYNSEEGLEIDLVGRDDLRNL
jgi:hypothetical protein